MKRWAWLLWLLSWPAWAGDAWEFSGSATLELRWYPRQALDPRQYDGGNVSVIVEPEFYRSFNDGNDSLLFAPYLQADQHDGSRNRLDIRELTWVHVGENWELRSGIRQEYWGVTEFQHLVDVINQFDNAVDLDNEDKLGQPMINLSLVRDWGILDYYLLPGFRERSWPGTRGRLRPPLPVLGPARYQSGQGNRHVDHALRWSHTLGDVDLGLAWFRGTNREPLLMPDEAFTRLTPYYEQMEQFSLELQATLGDWLWKLEAYHRSASLEDYRALQAGFEYTRYGVMDSAADLGLLLEYGWNDSRQASYNLFQNDLFTGFRLALNDTQSSEVLAGVSQDLDGGGTTLLLEASRRLGNDWKASLTGRWFHARDASDPLYYFRRENMIEFRLSWFWAN